jgi:triosephosphate isomerase
MNGLKESVSEARALAELFAGVSDKADVAVCPPNTIIMAMADALRGSGIAVGAQDCHFQTAGAHTGDVSAKMLCDAGARLVILGHSERRAAYAEPSSVVAAKAAAACEAGLMPIICVGESLEERRLGQTLAVIETQLKGSIPRSIGDNSFAVAYEPVWAIGSGLTPTIEEIANVHKRIREWLLHNVDFNAATIPILYGGSVKPSNATAILTQFDVGGALVGGASLAAKDFFAIIQAAVVTALKE